MLQNIQVLGHNALRFVGEKILYVDPFQLKEVERDADLVLITHSHYDHYSPEDIARISRPDTLLILPEEMRTTEKSWEGRVLYVKPDRTYEAAGVAFETVRAYNRDKAFHPKEKDWVGYILHWNGRRYYVAGDTDDTPEAEQVRCDVAFLPVGGTYTMNVEEAAALARKLRPRLAVPVHYGSIVGDKEDGLRFAEALRGEVPVEVLL